MLSFSTIYGQSYEPLEDKDPVSRFFISPDFSLVLGNLTSIEFSPLFGYHISPRFIAGAGGKYQYYSEKSYISSQMDIRTSIFGSRVFSRFILIKDINEIINLNIPLGIFTHIELESLNLEEKYFRIGYSGSDERYWLNSLLAGVGLSQQTGYRSYFNLMVLWDLTGGASSPFSYPVIKFGLQIYL